MLSTHPPSCDWAVAIHTYAWTEALARRIERARDSLTARGCALVVVTSGFQMSTVGATTVDGDDAAWHARLPSLFGGGPSRLRRVDVPTWNGDRGVLIAAAARRLDPPPNYWWNVEYDVDWKGDLADILASWERDDADLLCVKPQHANGTWPHFAKHDAGAWLEAVDKVRCFVTVARVSRALVDDVLAVAAEPNHRAYLELRLPSECARQQRLHGNCTTRSLFIGANAERQGALFEWTGSLRHRRWENATSVERRRAWETAPNGTLWHPVKDPGAWALGGLGPGVIK
jgi:hypothetical protein